jgi:hypothetical protein
MAEISQRFEKAQFRRSLGEGNRIHFVEDENEFAVQGSNIVHLEQSLPDLLAVMVGILPQSLAIHND